MIGLVIVSDVQVFREGLALALERNPDLEVAQAASRPGEAARVIRRRAPQVALIDQSMESPLVLMSSLSRDAPGVAQVAMGVRGDPQEILKCAEAGASGFVPRQASLKDLERAIRDAHDGALRCTPEISHLLCCHVSRLKAGKQSRNDGRPKQKLTRRERQILELIERGQPNKTIARELGIELSTVKNHVHSLLAKLGVRRRGEAAALHRRRDQ